MHVPGPIVARAGRAMQDDAPGMVLAHDRARMRPGQRRSCEKRKKAREQRGEQGRARWGAAPGQAPRTRHLLHEIPLHCVFDMTLRA
ncbi:hypothetical protein AQZ50_13865 [Novosphingobium sp. Fuku2-ISO-50]|nr:hypothetical protein AQZ50_13865 [Novosphingobium sp. Fuku2-ISO-50]